MTTIAFKDGVIAADSRVTYETEGGGSTKHICTKLFRRTIKTGKKKPVDVIIATAGQSSPGMVFVDWFSQSGGIGPTPEVFIGNDADFACLILTPHGLFEADRFCRPELILDSFYAVGSGRKEALAIMHYGGSARDAVRIAAKIDPYTGGRITTMTLTSKELPRGKQGK